MEPADRSIGTEPDVRRVSGPITRSRWFPVALILVGLAAVLFLADLQLGLGGMSHRLRQSVQFALTSLALIGCTAAYLWSIARATPLGRPWFALVLGCNALVVTVKFVVSPNAYRISGADVTDYLAVGLVVMAFYLLAPAMLFLVARRHGASRPWSWPLRVLLFCAIVGVGAIARFVAVPIVGGPASEYLHHVFSGAKLILPVAIGLMAILLIAAFERASTVPDQREFEWVTTTFTASAALIVVYHVLWIIFMVKVY